MFVGLCLRLVEFEILNNFCHHYPAALWIESEKRFNASGVEQFWNMICHGQDIFWAIFSFFGHFGVPIFLFLSGYGLVKKYEQSNNVEWNPFKFLLYSAVKMYKLIIPIIVICLITAFVNLYNSTHDILETMVMLVDKEGIKTLQTLTFTNGLFRRHSFGGAWWFIPLIMECYVCYAIFHRWNNKILLVIASFVSILLQAIFIATNNTFLLVCMRWNCFGWILPFAMGIWAARYDFPKSNWLCAVAWIAFFLSSFFAYLWIIQSAFLLFACFSMDIVNMRCPRWLVFIGIISPYIFVTHSFVRNMIIKSMLSYTGCLVFVILSILVAITYKYLSNILYKRDFQFTNILK